MHIKYVAFIIHGYVYLFVIEYIIELKYFLDYEKEISVSQSR